MHHLLEQLIRQSRKPSSCAVLFGASQTRNYSSSKIRMVKGKLSSHGEGSVESTWFTSKGTRPSSLDMGRFGLKRLNYATMEPPVWNLPPHPPTKSVTEKILFPVTVAMTAAVVAWAYMNPEEDDMREYWKRVETGQILVDDDDDEEEWDEEDEED